MGRITEFSGLEASGKSLLAYHILANCQKMGGLAIYIDTERAANKDFMERMGIDWSKLYRPNPIPASIQEVFEFIEKVISLARTKNANKEKPVVIVWDSIAATPGAEEHETAYTDNQAMGLEARIMSRSMRKVIKALDEGYVTLICINQLRETIGGLGWGDKYVTPYGKSVPFYSSVRVRLTSIKKIPDSKTDEIIGVNTLAKVYKNKVAPNNREVIFPLFYDWGVNDEISLMDFLVDHEVITGTTWKTLVLKDKEYKWQGTAKWIEMMKDPEVKKFVLDKVSELMVKVFKERPDEVSAGIDIKHQDEVF